MLKILDHIEEWLIAFLMGGATLIIFFAVLHRGREAEFLQQGAGHPLQRTGERTQLKAMAVDEVVGDGALTGLGH